MTTDLQYAKRLTNFFGRDKLVFELGPDDFPSLRADLSKPKAQKRKGKVVRKAKQALSLNGLASKIRHIKVFFNYAYAEFGKPVSGLATRQELQ